MIVPQKDANIMAETPTDTDILGDYDLSGVDLDDDLAVAAELAAEGAAGIEEANAAISDTPTTPVSSSAASGTGNSRSSGGGGKGDILSSVGQAASGGGGTPRSSPSSGDGALAGATKSNGEPNGSHSGGRKSSGSRKVRWYRGLLLDSFDDGVFNEAFSYRGRRIRRPLKGIPRSLFFLPLFSPETFFSLFYLKRDFSKYFSNATAKLEYSLHRSASGRGARRSKAAGGVALVAGRRMALSPMIVMSTLGR